MPAIIFRLKQDKKERERSDYEDRQTAKQLLIFLSVIILPILLFLTFKRAGLIESSEDVKVRTQIEELEKSYEETLKKRDEAFKKLNSAEIDDSLKVKLAELEEQFDETLELYKKKLDELKERHEKLKKK